MNQSCGLYLHIPFCAYHCHYCSFVTFLSQPHHVNQYVDYLIREIELYQGQHQHIDTIYFGGGTPSVLSSEQMSRIMSAIDKVFNVKADAEISTEMNPESISISKLKALHSMGFNRFSIGAQSFHDDVLKMMGRIHRRSDIIQKINWMKDLNIDNISIDLMFNNPLQTKEILLEDLKQFVSLGIDHLSIYSLMIEPGTQFERWLKKGQIKIAEDEAEREMYHLIKDTLKAHEFEQYEFSNFARDGKYCQHNLKYWHQEDYIGIGLGAAGNMGDIRYENHRDFISYYEAIDSGRSPVMERYHLSKSERAKEFVMLNMRLSQGLSLIELNDQYQLDLRKEYPEVLDKHQKNGLIVLEDDRLKFTSLGMDLANQFYMDLI